MKAEEKNDQENRDTNKKSFHKEIEEKFLDLEESIQQISKKIEFTKTYIKEEDDKLNKFLVCL